MRLAVTCGGVGGKAIKAPRVPEVYEIGFDALNTQAKNDFG